MLKRRRVLAGLVVAGLVAGGIAAALGVGSGNGKQHTRSQAKPRQTTRAVRPAPAPTPPRRVRGRHDTPVPILMYHVIATPPASAPYPELFVSRGDFVAQMRWLAHHGYHAVSLRRVYDYWTRSYALPPKPIVISFDDGYLADYTTAMPVLRSLGWAGVLNLEVNNVRPGDLTAAQIRGLIRAGWEVDAHTITHPDLRAVGDAQLQREVAGSRAEIRRRFGVPVDFFCYPAGMYDDRVVAAVRAAGYLAATTVNFGLASPSNGLFTLNRVRISGSDGIAGFASKLR